MTEHEKYQEHIRHTHDTFCKTVIRHTAIDAARSIRSRRRREISLEYLIDEKRKLDKNWRYKIMQNTMKFAVARMLGDEATILKLFDGDQKEAAMAYGQQAAKGYDTGLICVIKAAFTPEGERADNRYRLYKGFPCEG